MDCQHCFSSPSGVLVTCFKDASVSSSHQRRINFNASSFQNERASKLIRRCIEGASKLILKQT